MIIIGFDPGSQCFGIAIMKDSVLYKTFLLKSSKKHRFDRMKDIAGRMEVIFDALQSDFLTDEIFFSMESGFQGKYRNASGTLGEARGLIISLAARKKIKLFEFAPSKIKKAVGDGKMSKAQVIRMIEAMHRCEGLSEHEADAAAAALCLWHRRREMELI